MRLSDHPAHASAGRDDVKILKNIQGRRRKSSLCYLAMPVAHFPLPAWCLKLAGVTVVDQSLTHIDEEPPWSERKARDRCQPRADRSVSRRRAETWSSSSYRGPISLCCLALSDKHGARWRGLFPRRKGGAALIQRPLSFFEEPKPAARKRKIRPGVRRCGPAPSTKKPPLGWDQRRPVVRDQKVRTRMCLKL